MMHSSVRVYSDSSLFQLFLGVISIVFGVVFFIIGRSLYIEMTYVEEHGERITAIVVDAELPDMHTTADHRPYYSQDYSCSYTYNGNAYISKVHDANSTKAGRSDGDRVTVIVDTTNPDKVYLPTEVSGKYTFLLFGIFAFTVGAIFVVCALKKISKSRTDPYHK